MKLNLGSCDRAFEGFLSVDLCPPADIIADLEAPWPWEAGSVEELRAYDIIEHIGDCDHNAIVYACRRCYPQRCGTAYGNSVLIPVTPPKQLSRGIRAFSGPIHVMNEAHRVLIPGGVFDIEVPTTEGRGAWQDPTHRSFWNRNSFLYYTHGDPHRERFGDHYGVTARFTVEHEETKRWPDGVVKLKIRLRAVK